MLSFQMTLQGIGLTGASVDLDVGTAIFARHVEKGMWNDAYVRHIEEMYWDKDLEAIDVVGYNPIRKEKRKKQARSDQLAYRLREFFGYGPARSTECEL